MVIDGLGVRLSGSPIGYAAWQAVAQGAPMPFVYLLLRQRWPTMAVDANLGRVAVGAAISVLAYGVVLWAMSLSPMGQVSALRETSILFAAVVGAVFLREPFTPRGVLGGIRRAVRFLPFFRAFLAIEATLLALLAAVVDAIAGDLTGTRALLIVLVPVALVTVTGHLVAILASKRLE